MKRFEGTVALITGAGSGIGRAITRRLCDEGASVFAVEIDKARLDETLGLVEGTVAGRPADVGDPDACSAAVDACLERFGRLDVLGNVAGIYRAAHTTAMSRDDYRLVMTRQPRRAILPLPGRHPAPSGVRRQHRQHCVQLGYPGSSVLCRLFGQ